MVVTDQFFVPLAPAILTWWIGLLLNAVRALPPVCVGIDDWAGRSGRASFITAGFVVVRP